MSHKVLDPCNCPKVIFTSGRTVVPVTEWLIERKFNIGLADKTVRADADHLGKLRLSPQYETMPI